MPVLLTPGEAASQEETAARISAAANALAARKAKANIRSRVAEARKMEATISGFGPQAGRAAALMDPEMIRERREMLLEGGPEMYHDLPEYERLTQFGSSVTPEAYELAAKQASIALYGRQLGESLARSMHKEAGMGGVGGLISKGKKTLIGLGEDLAGKLKRAPSPGASVSGAARRAAPSHVPNASREIIPDYRKTWTVRPITAADTPIPSGGARASAAKVAPRRTVLETPTQASPAGGGPYRQAAVPPSSVPAPPAAAATLPSPGVSPSPGSQARLSGGAGFAKDPVPSRGLSPAQKAEAMSPWEAEGRNIKAQSAAGREAMAARATGRSPASASPAELDKMTAEANQLMGEAGGVLGDVREGVAALPRPAVARPSSKPFIGTGGKLALTGLAGMGLLGAGAIARGGAQAASPYIRSGVGPQETYANPHAGLVHSPSQYGYVY